MEPDDLQKSNTPLKVSQKLASERIEIKLLKEKVEQLKAGLITKDQNIANLEKEVYFR